MIQERISKHQAILNYDRKNVKNIRLTYCKIRKSLKTHEPVMQLLMMHDT